jgi:serine/threonine protein phosphatase PrpC
MASLARECLLLTNLLLSDSIPALDCSLFEAFSIAKTARRLPSENEDALVHFSVENFQILAVIDGHGGNKLARFLKERISSIAAEIRDTVVKAATRNSLSSGTDGAAVPAPIIEADHESAAAADRADVEASSAEMVDKISELFSDPRTLSERWSEISGFSDATAFYLWLILTVAEERAIAEASVDTATSGGCVSLVLIDLCRAKATAMWLGDAGVAVVKSDATTKFRSSDHRVGSSLDERRRVETCGGKIFRNRAVGVEWSNLGVTRAMGDSLWKCGNLWTRDASCGKSGKRILDEDLVLFSRARGCTGISGVPEVAVIPLEPDDVVIVGSDGFWELKIPPKPQGLREAVAAAGVLHDDTTVVAVKVDTRNHSNS